MRWLDYFERRALVLAAWPAFLFLVLVVRCFVSPALGMGATLPFVAVLLMSWGPLVYLALFRAWGQGWIRVESGGRHPFWSHLGPSALLVLFSTWVWWLHSGRIGYAKDELAQKTWSSMLRDEPLQGLDLFGEAMVPLGIIVPMISVGILWFLLPGEP